MRRCCWSSRTRTGSTRPTADVLAFVARRIESDPIVLLAADARRLPLGARRARAAGAPARRPRRRDGRVAARRRRAGPSARRARARAARGRRQPAGAARAAGGDEPTPTSRAGGAAADRAARARVRRPRRPICPRTRGLSLLVAALSDDDAVGEILQAASAVAGTRARSRRAGAGRRGRAHRPRRQLDPLPASADALRGPAERRACSSAAACTRRSPTSLDADPDRRVWHRAALMSGTHEELARELEEAGRRAPGAGAPSTSR